MNEISEDSSQSQLVTALRRNLRLCPKAQSSQDKKRTIVLWLRALTFCLARSRFSMIVLLVGLVLLMSDQGRDVLTAYSEDGRTVRVAASAAIWALSIWGWCRLLLDIQYHDPPSCLSCYNLWRRWIPRILGSLAFLAVWFSAYQAGQSALAWSAIVGFVLFLVFVIVRRPATRQVTTRLSKSRHDSLRSAASTLTPGDIGPESVPPFANLCEALGIPDHERRLQGERPKLRAWVVLAMFLTFLLLAMLGTFAPVFLGSHSGAMILFFLWAATWLPLGSLMSYIADTHGVPLISLLAIAALISSCFNDNHEIRRAVDGVPVNSRPTVTDALNGWENANQPTNKHPAPFIVVATAGGGIRAAYWTATVLGNLQDNVPLFSRNLFALSGVSGGSLGATVYRALLDVPPAQLKAACPDKFTNCAQQILGKDFLGPLSAALLYPDLAQRFFPSPIFPDRATALEKSWEQAFDDVTTSKAGNGPSDSATQGLRGTLAALNTDQWAPALFLNATWIDNGRRIVASNLRIARVDESQDEANAFKLLNDELAILGYDLRLSTAAHNSARFPFVSPPGMWRHNGKISGRLQDGGLFENYGAETALEILNYACIRFACTSHPETRIANNSQSTPQIKPVVIMITSDPSLPENFADSPERTPIRFGYEVRSTFRAYERVRGGRGAEASATLKEWARQHGDNFFYFRMCPSNSNAEQPPLGWALSETARKTISGYLSNNRPDAPPCYRANMLALQQLTRLLGG